MSSPQQQGKEQAGRADARAGLTHFGWSQQLETSFAPYAARGWVPGRVSVGYGVALHVRTDGGEVWAVVPGRMRHRARTPEDVPVVGDWVALRLLKAPKTVLPDTAPDGQPDSRSGEARGENGESSPRRFEAEAVVEAVLPRRSRLARKAAGSPFVQQVLAANVDYAWLVSALGPDFNARRIERYLALAREGSTQPVIVLNKADLVTPEEAQQRVEEARELAGAGVPVHAVSSFTAQGMGDLSPYLSPGKTIVLLGSSGVGKSSLVNRLMGEELLDTQEVTSYGKGRHTTTRRELVPMPDGALLIDTPGIRELQVWEGERGVEEAFPDIEELALRCRFTNCGHGTEPGCAVLAAVAEDRLPAERLDAWRKLLEEARIQEAQREERARAEESRRARFPQRGGARPPRRS